MASTSARRPSFPGRSRIAPRDGDQRRVVDVDGVRADSERRLRENDLGAGVGEDGPERLVLGLEDDRSPAPPASRRRATRPRPLVWAPGRAHAGACPSSSSSRTAGWPQGRWYAPFRGDYRAAGRPRSRWGVRGEVLGGPAARASRRLRPDGLREPPRRPRPCRRRRGLSALRRAGDRLHHRLLSLDGGRPRALRRGRGHERAERRLRHGREAAPCALGGRVSRGASTRVRARDVRRGGGQGRGGGGGACRGSHDPRRGGEVRARRGRARRIPTGSGGRTAPARETPSS